MAFSQIEELGHLGIATKDDIGGAGVDGAGIGIGGTEVKGECNAERTTMSLSSTTTGVSLRHGAGALIDADGPLREGPTQGLFAIAFFDFVAPS